MTTKLIGEIKDIKDLETKGTFSFRNMWMVIDGETKYPQIIEVQFAQTKADMLDMYSIGDQVEIEANIRGREYNGRVYVSLSAWTMKLANGMVPNQHKVQAPTSPAYKAPVAAPVVEEDYDSLPF